MMAEQKSDVLPKF